MECPHCKVALKVVETRQRMEGVFRIREHKYPADADCTQRRIETIEIPYQNYLQLSQVNRELSNWQSRIKSFFKELAH